MFARGMRNQDNIAAVKACLLTYCILAANLEVSAFPKWMQIDILNDVIFYDKSIV